MIPDQLFMAAHQHMPWRPFCRLGMIPDMIRRLLLLAGCLTSCAPQLLWAASVTTRPTKNLTLSQSVQQQTTTLLDRLQNNGDFAAARQAIANLFDQVISVGPTREAAAFRETAFVLRLLSQLEATPAPGRTELLKYLRANPTLARTLAFLVHPEEKPSEIYAVLDRLRRGQNRSLEAYATLAAAICVVHDRPLNRQVNENRAKAADPLRIFDFFCRNEERMLFKIRPVPAELLVYVVDTTASIEEMEWALDRYAGDPQVGGRFFDVKYDHNHVRNGTPKQLTLQGFNLPNILQCGGVCADQAYFASHVGKAVGVPTAVASASSGDMGHAWVGFFQATARQGWWNFDVGRYPAYRGIRGNVLDPQSRQTIPDSYVALLAEMIGSSPEARHAAAALTDAAVRLGQLEKNPKTIVPLPTDNLVVGTVLPKPRITGVAAELELLEAAVRLCPGDRRAWFVVRDLAQDGKLTLDQKRQWAGAIEQVCGAKYPDFAVAILTPMIQTVHDVAEQERLWNQAFDRFRNRADLAAAIRMAQAAMWEASGQTERAGLCYMDVIERYANAGPFVIDALQSAEKALIRAGRPERVVELYDRTWQRIERPKDTFSGTFITQSNWFRVGLMLAARLENAGATESAAALRAELQQRAGTIASPR